jgi:hypothetical protein
MNRLIAGACALLTGLAACSTPPGSADLADEQVCINHFQNNPTEQARCRLDPALRPGSAPEADPAELPLRTGQPSD